MVELEEEEEVRKGVEELGVFVVDVFVVAVNVIPSGNHLVEEVGGLGQ